MLGHRGRRACLFPFRRVDHPRRCQVVERHVFRTATARAEPSRAQDARNAGERGDVLGVVPRIEGGLDYRAGGHADQKEPAGICRRGVVASKYLLAFITQQALDLAGHALRPRRKALAADCAVIGALQQHQPRLAHRVTGGSESGSRPLEPCWGFPRCDSRTPPHPGGAGESDRRAASWSCR